VRRLRVALIRKTSLLMALIGLLSLGACSGTGPAALTLDSSSRLPVMVLGLCEEETVQTVTLSAIDRDDEVYRPGRPIWRIVADGGERQTHFTAGIVPFGFHETVPLDKSRLDGDLQFRAVSDGGAWAAHEEVFKMSELRQGVLLQYGRPIKEPDLAADGRASCDPLGAAPPWLFIVFATGVVGSLLVILTDVRRRRRAQASAA
jgi:hypothetical protein